jgi:hypothetical protein
MYITELGSCKFRSSFFQVQIVPVPLCFQIGTCIWVLSAEASYTITQLNTTQHNTTQHNMAVLYTENK